MVIEEKILKEIESEYGIKSLNQICKERNLPYSKVYCLLKNRNNIKISVKNNGKTLASKQYAENLKKIKNEDVDVVIDCYVNKKYSMQKIAKIFKVTATTILKLLRDKNIKTRLQNGKEELKKPKYKKSLLYKLYIKDKKSLQEICDLLDYKNSMAVKHDMNFYNIKCRNYSDAGHNMYKTKPKLKEKIVTNWLKSMQSKRDNLIKTNIEQMFFDWCNKNNIECIYQYMIENVNHRYDFYLPKYKILIEIDGNYWHEDIQQIMIDKWYTDKAVKSGYQIFRFWGSDVLKEKHDLFERILNEKLK